MSDFKTIEDIRREEVQKALLVTVADVAELHRCSQDHVRRWVKEVGLKEYKIGRNIRYSLVDVNDKMQNHLTGNDFNQAS